MVYIPGTSLEHTHICACTTHTHTRRQTAYIWTVNADCWHFKCSRLQLKVRIIKGLFQENVARFGTQLNPFLESEAWPHLGSFQIEKCTFVGCGWTHTHSLPPPCPVLKSTEGSRSLIKCNWGGRSVRYSLFTWKNKRRIWRRRRRRRDCGGESWEKCKVRGLYTKIRRRGSVWDRGESVCVFYLSIIEAQVFIPLLKWP